jgi:hypothetical protein
LEAFHPVVLVMPLLKMIQASASGLAPMICGYRYRSTARGVVSVAVLTYILSTGDDVVAL